MPKTDVALIHLYTLNHGCACINNITIHHMTEHRQFFKRFWRGNTPTGTSTFSIMCSNCGGANALRAIEAMIVTHEAWTESRITASSPDGQQFINEMLPLAGLYFRSEGFDPSS